MTTLCCQRKSSSTIFCLAVDVSSALQELFYLIQLSFASLLQKIEVPQFPLGFSRGMPLTVTQQGSHVGRTVVDTLKVQKLRKQALAQRASHILRGILSLSRTSDGSQASNATFQALATWSTHSLQLTSFIKHLRICTFRSDLVWMRSSPHGSWQNTSWHRNVEASAAPSLGTVDVEVIRCYFMLHLLLSDISKL